LPLQVIVNITKPLNVSDFGMYQLELINNEDEKWITGISIHLLDPAGEGYAPTIYVTSDFVANEIQGPIQRAIDTWEGDDSDLHEKGGIIFIPPHPDNPKGAHLENLIMGSPPAKLQGIGPGGDIVVDEATRGTHLNGGNFGSGVLCTGAPAADNFFCDTQATAAWRNAALGKATNDMGNLGLVEGSVLYVLGSKAFYQDNDWAEEALTGGIDGCLISGGTQLNPGPFVPTDPNTPVVVAVQGGGITVSC
jgi:hypothetical protein